MKQTAHLVDFALVGKSRWRSYEVTKRAMDILAALLLLALIWPILLLVALAIKIDSAGPIFFVRERVGQRLTTFRLYKFRTMHSDSEQRYPELFSFASSSMAPHNIYLQYRDDPRVTRVGRVLRTFSLDELPNILNVLKGNMSLVGPRPEAIEMLKYYQSYEKFLVKPGITGLAQTNGRGNLNFADTVSYDVDYVRRRSLITDLKILLRTPGAVLWHRGAF